MNDQSGREVRLVPSAIVLQAPYQAPAIDRTPTAPTGADNDASGVEADFLPIPLLAGLLGGLLA